MKEPTVISDSHISSINLICNRQPNLLLYSDIHHQVVYVKFDMKGFYPPHFERIVRHYQHPSIELIKRAIKMFDWKRVLEY